MVRASTGRRCWQRPIRHQGSMRGLWGHRGMKWSDDIVLLGSGIGLVVIGVGLTWVGSNTASIQDS